MSLSGGAISGLLAGLAAIVALAVAYFKGRRAGLEKRDGEAAGARAHELLSESERIRNAAAAGDDAAVQKASGEGYKARRTGQEKWGDDHAKP